MNPEQADSYLKADGSSIRALRRQIEGEIAGSGFSAPKIESNVSVGDDEVKAVLDKMNASKGTEEYRVSEIFLSATPDNGSADGGQRQQDLEQLRRRVLRGLCPSIFRSIDRRGGRRPRLGSARTASAPLAAAVRQMGPGSVSQPIPVPGGISIMAVQDTRKILTADPRDAVLSLKQVSIEFPKGTARQLPEPIVARFSQAARNVGGCGGAEDRRGVQWRGRDPGRREMRDLPPALQRMMMPMQVGRATQPFGSLEEGVRTLVICGRDEVDPTAPSYDEVYNQINEERLNIHVRAATCGTCAAMR